MATPLAPGTRLGRYEIEALIGSGGMGCVYRARDPRLSRSVAIKTLIPSADQPDQGRRFASEAKLVGALDHPNLLVVYDVGHELGVDYLVSELLDGETLRARLLRAGAIPESQLITYAIQLAEGLTVAHGRDIVHRDLKPENLFLTKGQRLKILDFGIAKRVHLPDHERGADGTLEALTGTGMIIGTVGYMAPEQVLGEPVDSRADLFALGVVMYEMVTGAPPFQRDSAIATLNAILVAPAPPITPGISAALDSIIRRCLEKERERRFQSATDLAFALQLVQGVPDAPPSSSRDAASPTVATSSRMSRRQALGVGSGVVAAVAAGGVSGVFVERAREHSIADYRRLTFRRGLIRSARLAPDGQTMMYGALWDGEPCRVFSGRLDGTESGAVDLPPANILAISRTGELAVALGSQRRGIITYGTLARVPPTGGTPRELAANVKFADWSPDGASLAVIRQVDGRDRLEYPLGTVLLDPPVGSSTGLGFARVSPDGKSVAYLRYRDPGSLAGYIATIDASGREQQLSAETVNCHGLTWRGEEIWYTSSEDRPLFRVIRAVTRRGSNRLVARIPGNVTIWDAHTDGRVLLAHTDDRTVLISRRPEDVADRDLSWLDASRCADLSADGRQLLFTELGQGGGPHGSVYLRHTDGAPAVRLGEGLALALSPDGQWAMCGGADTLSGASATSIVLIPTGAGTARTIEGRGHRIRTARFLPDGQHAIVLADAPPRAEHLVRVNLQDGTFAPISEDGVIDWALSPDGTQAAVTRTGEAVQIVDLASRRSSRLPGSTPADHVLEWTRDGVLVIPDGTSLASLGQVERIVPSSGARDVWGDIMLQDPAGIMTRYNLVVTPDGRSRAYTWHRALSSLYVASDLA